MKVVVATNVVAKVFNNKIYFEGPFSTVLTKYYNYFGKVILCTRIRYVNDVPEKVVDVTDMIDDIIGTSGFLKPLLHAEDKRISKAVEKCDLVIGRLPSSVAYRAIICARKMGIPYMVEAMTCAWDAFFNHSFLGKLIAPYMFYTMKKLIKNANYVIYVTKSFLQNRYPCNCKSINASNVRLSIPKKEIIDKRFEKIEQTNKKCINLMTCAVVDVKHKGQEYVIRALPDMIKRGINITYYLVGGGDQERLRSIAKKMGVENRVVFTGRLSYDEVMNALDMADIYIQPSLQEGLPRAMIEAMSRGCICLGAKTAGIPELVNSEFIFKPKNTKAIVKAMSNVCSMENWKDISEGNYLKALDYEECILDSRRTEYFDYIKTKEGF